MAEHTPTPTPARREGSEGDVLGLQVGPFVLQEEVGVGGFGAVYRATHIERPGVFAIKLIHWHQAKDPALLKRFKREAQTLAQLQHPNVVRLIDFGHIDSVGFYMVMEFLNGIGLQELLQRFYPLPSKRLKELVRQLCLVLSFAHSQGVLHRDLKPSNIIMCTGPEGDIVKLIDFGIAAVSEQTQLTQTGTFLGSPAYMSPEQIKGESKLMAPQSDLYSLGIILVQLLTQKKPFEASNLTGYVTHHLFTPPPTLGTLRPEQPWHPLLEAFVARALAKETHARFPHATALWQAFSMAMDAQGELALPSLPRTQLLPTGPYAGIEGSKGNESPTRQIEAFLATRTNPAVVTSLLDNTANLGAPDPLVTHNHQPLPTPSLPHPVHFQQQFTGQLPPQTPAHEASQPIASPMPKSRQIWLVVLTALLGGALVACVWLLATRPTQPSPEPTQGAATSSQVLIKSSPTGAHIWRGNKVLGKTPQALVGDPGEQGKVTLRKPGYAPVVVTWTYRTQRFVRDTRLRSLSARPAMPMPLPLMQPRQRPRDRQPALPALRPHVAKRWAPRKRPRTRRRSAPRRRHPILRRATKAVDPFDGLLSPTRRR